MYRKFYTEEKERSNGVVAICVTKPASQPHNILASIISVSLLLANCLQFSAHSNADIIANCVTMTW